MIKKCVLFLLCQYIILVYRIWEESGKGLKKNLYQLIYELIIVLLIYIRK